MLSVIVGVTFFLFGLLGLECGCLVWLVVPNGTGQGDWDAILVSVVYFFFIATWLFIGVVMMNYSIELFDESLKNRP